MVVHFGSRAEGRRFNSARRRCSGLGYNGSLLFDMRLNYGLSAARPRPSTFMPFRRRKRASFQGRLAGSMLEGEEQLPHCLPCSFQSYVRVPLPCASSLLVAMAGAASGYAIEEQALAAEPVLDLEGGAAEAESDGTADEALENNQAAALRQLAQAAAAFPGHDRISQLRAEQRALREDAKAVSQRLRNEQRKRRRLMEKARNLNTEDLVMILGARAAAKGMAKAKAKAKAKAAA